MRKLLSTIYVICLILVTQVLLAATPTLEYQVNGLNETMQKNALAWLAAEQKNTPTPLNDDAIQTLYQAGFDDINQALKPYGYYNPKVTGKLSHTNHNAYLANYQVSPGTPIPIVTVQIKLLGPGANNTTLQKLQRQCPLKVGQAINTVIYQQYKNKLINTALEQGYLDAKFTTSQIAISLVKKQADINLVFETGPQYYFGKVFFSKNPMNEYLLQRFVTASKIMEGAVYSPNQLQILQQNLSNSHYFSNVDIEPSTHDLSNTTVPIHVNLTPSPKQQYNFGVGYSTDTGVRGTLGVNWNRLTPSGQSFRTLLQASQVITSLDAKYSFPGKNPITDQYFLSANITTQTPNTSKGTTEKVSAGQAMQWHQWKTTLALSQQFDQYNLRGGPRLQSHLTMPSINLVRGESDDPIFPRHAYTVSLMGRGATTALDSSTNFAQTELFAKWITSPTPLSRLLLRGDLGLTAVKNPDTIPLSLQFFAGGADSVRGYNYEQLGPGRYLMVGSVEFQHQVVHNWYGAVFFDAGNAFDNFVDPASQGKKVGDKNQDVNLNQLLKAGTGVGIVWVSPVGPMELTLAKAVGDSHMKPLVQFTMSTNL